MATLQSQITIHRPKEDVWHILSNLTTMSNYMPGIKDVHLISEEKRGVGTARHCTFDDGVELHERVVEWTEGQGYTLETTRFVKVPMKANEITFSLRDNGSHTIVSQSMHYKMKGGPFAPILEFMAKSMMSKALNGALAGLKEYAETQSRPKEERQ